MLGAIQQTHEKLEKAVKRQDDMKSKMKQIMRKATSA